MTQEMNKRVKPIRFNLRKKSYLGLGGLCFCQHIIKNTESGDVEKHMA